MSVKITEQMRSAFYSKAEVLSTGTVLNLDAALEAALAHTAEKGEAEPVGWETEAEWELEQRAFNWNAAWSEEKTRELINDLWRQYCLAADPAPRDDLVAEVERLRVLLADARPFVTVWSIYERIDAALSESTP